MRVQQLRRPKLTMPRDEFERPVRISAAEVNTSEDFLDVLEVGLQHIEKVLPSFKRKQSFDRFDMSRLQRVGAREISVVPRLGEIRELDQGISDFVHRRDNDGFSFALLRAHDGRDLAITFGIGETRAAKLMNDPW